ncbi:MAG: amidohydrolase [SAR202 cluster bacterium]|nr:amidohydrolase [SAR202 cluster bacterium]
MVKYNLISGDSHVDMSWLPGDLFVKNCSKPELLELMPRIVETKKGLQWIAEKDNVLGVAQSAGFEFIAPTRGRRMRTDKMLDAGFYDGPARPVDPELRLKDMMTDGVDCEILYGITGSGKNLKQMPVVTEVYRIYNDWVNEFGASYPGRWYGLACLPVHDSKLAAAEARRVANLKFIRGCDLMAGGLNYPLYARDGYWDGLWEAMVDINMPISFHIGGTRIPIGTTPDMETGFAVQGRDFTQNEQAFQLVRGALGMFSMVQHMMSMIASGALDKFPKLKFVMAECGVGWVPFALDRMDHVYHDGMYENKFTSPSMKMKPSEYWARNGMTTFQEEYDVADMIPLVGEDNIMWGSDYPHPDSVWPDSHKVLDHALNGVKPSIRAKITKDTATKLYKIGK